MASVWQRILSYTEEGLIVNQRDLISALGPAEVAYLEENQLHKGTLVIRYPTKRHRKLNTSFTQRKEGMYSILKAVCNPQLSLEKAFIALYE